MSSQHNDLIGNNMNFNTIFFLWWSKASNNLYVFLIEDQAKHPLI
jgi:hypothetical protein